MSNKIYVKLKDTSGSFFIASQNVSVNRSQLLEVEKDTVVTQAISKGALVEATEKEFNEYNDNRNALIEKEKEKTAVADVKTTLDGKELKKQLDSKPVDDTPAFGTAEAKALLEKAYEKKLASKDGDKVVVGKKPFESEEAFIQVLVDDEKVRNQVIKGLEA